jgi:predicted DNA-binding transcriptional regulator AlpA
MPTRDNFCASEAGALGCATSACPGTNQERHGPVAERYISRRELRALFPVSDMTIWRWQHDPQVGFPAPIKLSANGRNFWWLPAIRDWERRRREDAGEEVNLSRPLAQGGVDVAALH